MKLATRTRRDGRVAAAMALSLGLVFSQGAPAQDVHAGHDMAGMNMAPDASAMKPHAHHHADMHAPVKRSMVDVTLAATPMLRQDGSKTTLSQELEGKRPTILAFIYTSCTSICPVTSQVLSNVQDLLGAELKDARILSVSIDPEYDTPARLRAYSQKYGAKPQWQHYTGSLANSVDIQKAFGAYRGDKMNHAALFYVNSGGNKGWVKLEGFPGAQELVTELHAHEKG